MATYNGHKNWNYWNVNLWLTNDSGSYATLVQYKRQYGAVKGAKALAEALREEGNTHTPDGAPYSASAIRAIMQGL